jgi:hypothetical protein
MYLLRYFCYLFKFICSLYFIASCLTAFTGFLLTNTSIVSRNVLPAYATALQTEYAGFDRILQDTTFLSPLSHDLSIGSMAIEDLLKVVKSSSLDGGPVLAEHLETLREEARYTANDLQALQVKVDGVIDR